MIKYIICCLPKRMTDSESKPISKNNIIFPMSIIFIVCLFNGVDTCSKTITLNAQTSQCEISENQTELCTISDTVRLPLVPQGQVSCLFIKSSEDNLLGTI